LLGASHEAMMALAGKFIPAVNFGLHLRAICPRSQIILSANSIEKPAGPAEDRELWSRMKYD